MPIGDDPMTSALAKLSAAIQQQLGPQSAAAAREPLSRFGLMQKANTDLFERFERAEKALQPPREKRREAIDKLRKALKLNTSEWRLVFAGLSDKSEREAPLLEDDALFVKVHAEVDQRIHNHSLSRRDWLALCFSYFGYESAQPDGNANWCVLRSDVERGLVIVKGLQRREKEWMRIVDQHTELFTDKAGASLGQQMFEGQISDLSVLQTIAQIPDESWLWKRIFAVVLSRIFTLEDEPFLARIPGLMSLAQQHEKHTNDVLSACLTRYYQADYREQPSSLLKQAALDNWGSPQMRSRQNRWSQHVEPNVCAMVVAWFAREDLEHFFNLLKGDSEVDQSRLFYWLRFANQMSYTRIVMGSDAWSDTGKDFVQFREKNKGRLSRLVGGPSSNNAVIMHIGEYLFVEFSGTGNACYVYKAGSAPFSPEKPQLDLHTELKQRGRELKRMLHTPKPSSAKRIEGWLYKFDVELNALGIQVGGQASDPDKATSMGFDSRLKQAFEGSPHKIFDLRAKGGSYQVQLKHDDPAARTLLQQLGFKPVSNQPLRFWRN